MDDLINTSIPYMVAQGFPGDQARTNMRGMLPNLKYWTEKQ